MENSNASENPTSVRKSRSGKATRVFNEDGTDTIFVSGDTEHVYRQVLALGDLNTGNETEAETAGDLLGADSAITKIVDAVMNEPDIHPSLRYAWEVTGRVVTDENRTLLTPAELAEWYCVLHDWETTHSDEGFDEPPGVTEAVEETLAHYQVLRAIVHPSNPSGYILVDLLHIATLLVAGRLPAAADMLSRLAYQTSIEQIDVFIMIGGTLIRDSVRSGAVSQSEEIIDAVLAIGEMFNVDTEALTLLNAIELAEDSFNISGDYFTMVTTVVCCVAALLMCDLIDEEDIYGFFHPSP